MRIFLLRVMRLTALFLFLASMSLSAKTISQTVTFSGKNASLEQAFDAIRTQTGYFIVGDMERLNRSASITISVIHYPLNKFLDEILKGQPFTYVIEKKTIAIKPVVGNDVKNNVSFFTVAATPIKGYVTDGDGNALVGATIAVKNSNTSVKAGSDGLFVINANAGDALLISFIGYDVKEIKLSASLIKNGNIGTTALMISPTAMREVEVNKGYYTTKEMLNTGNVYTVKGEELRKQPVTDPVLALEGRVPGLMISQTSGVPGAPLQIQLRGKNFINKNLITANDPLYIVDGIPFNSQSFLASNIITIIPKPAGSGAADPAGLSPFNILNPNDIESIEVLKDADATAIYGSRGANGVIIINTRKGKAGRTNVNINLSQGYSKQVTTTELMNTQQYLQMRREAYKNDGLVIPSITTTPDDYNYDINGLWDTTRSTDWAHELMGRTAAYTNAQAGISGGNVSTQFLINAGYSRQGNYFPGDFADQKGSLHFQIGHASQDQRFHVDLSGSYLNDNNNVPPAGFSILNLAPDAPAIYDNQGNLNWQLYQGSSTWSNPLAYVNQTSTTLTHLLNGNLMLSYQIIKGLTLKTNFSYQTTQSTQQAVTPSTVSPPPYNADPNSRAFAFSTTSSQTWNNESQINYQRSIGKGTLDALIGSTLQNTKSNSIAYGASIYSSDALITNVQSASYFNLSYTSSPEYRFNSLYGRIGYNWDQKYVINLSGRRDGSSRFGPGRQFGDFGSVGIGWIFSKEVFIQTLFPWLSFGKIRGSYGTTGSDAINDYSFLSTYSSSSYFSGTYLGLTSLGPTSLTDPYLRWQRNRKLEGSIDLGFLQDRINISATYYRNRSDNQLVAYPLPYITGRAGVTTNFPALVQNSGWEFTFYAAILRRQNFSWNTSANISIPESKLVAYPGIETSPYSAIYTVGKSLFSLPLYHYLGVDPQTGLYSFAAKNGTGVPSSPQDLVPSKPITQQYFGGVSNTVNYKGFTVDFFIQFVKQRGYSYQEFFASAPPGYGFFAQPAASMNHWQKPGDQATAQRYTTGLTDYLPTALYNVFLASNGVITDASFVRLKNVQIAYQFPRSWLQQLHLQNMRLYLQCQNLFTVTCYQVLDPETQNIFAPVRTITAGIQLTL